MDKITGKSDQPRTDFLESILPNKKRVAVGRDAKWTAIVLALITLVGQQIFLNIEMIKTLYSPLENYLKPGVASLADYITIVNTFMLSAPVILAFSVIFIYVFGKFEKKEGAFGPSHFIVGAGLIYIAALIGNLLGFTPVRTAGLRPGNPYYMMAFILSDLYNSYGFILFFSSIVVGVFIARAWRTLTAD